MASSELTATVGFVPATQEVDRDVRLRRIVTEQYAFVWRCVRHLGVPPGDADDAAQQVLIVLAQKLDAVAIGSERAFLFSTAMRIASRCHRARGRRREVFDCDAVLDQMASTGSSASDRAPARALLDQVLEDMPVDLRAVFMLYEVEQFTMNEIAALVEVPVGTVASRLRRAREHFRASVGRLEARDHRGGVR